MPRHSAPANCYVKRYARSRVPMLFGPRRVPCDRSHWIRLPRIPIGPSKPGFRHDAQLDERALQCRSPAALVADRALQLVAVDDTGAYKELLERYTRGHSQPPAIANPGSW